MEKTTPSHPPELLPRSTPDPDVESENLVKIELWYILMTMAL
jgi:hypothetical protein